eukprot:571520-Amphidinium_carterae.1
MSTTPDALQAPDAVSSCSQRSISMSGRASTFKTWNSIFINELLSTIESGQKVPHHNNRDVSSCARECRSILLMICTKLTCTESLTCQVGCYLLERPHLEPKWLRRGGTWQRSLATGTRCLFDCFRRVNWNLVGWHGRESV